MILSNSLILKARAKIHKKCPFFDSKTLKLTFEIYRPLKNGKNRSSVKPNYSKKQRFFKNRRTSLMNDP